MFFLLSITSALATTKAIITRKGTHIKFIVCQLVISRRNPADNAPNACVLKTVRSLNPWALYFSSGLYAITSKLVPEINRKFQPMPRNINEIR